MSQVFDAYAAYYDLLYRDKDYRGEVAYLNRLLEKHAPGSRSLLELGCGTGGHALQLARLGHAVHGIDCSETMLERARQEAAAQRSTRAGSLSFEHGDIRSWRSTMRYDAALSLFHVFSYQTSDEDIRAAIATAASSVRPGGVLLADFWHGPGVVATGPEPRSRVLENESVRVTRLARPVHRADAHRVDVRFDMQVEDLRTGCREEFHEIHEMRYFFRDELENWLTEAGMELVAHHAWLAEEAPSERDWAALLVARLPG